MLTGHNGVLLNFLTHGLPNLLCNDWICTKPLNSIASATNHMAISFLLPCINGKTVLPPVNQTPHSLLTVSLYFNSLVHISACTLRVLTPST